MSTSQPAIEVIASAVNKASEEHIESIRRDWISTLEGKRYLSELSSKDADSILTTSLISEGIVPDVREMKVLVIGRNASGKTATIHNLCTREIPASYVETSGTQVLSSYWPVQLRSNRVVILKLKFWDCGFNSSKKFTYLGEASNQDPKVILFIFSMTDRESYEEMQRQILAQLDSKAVKMIIATKIDLFQQSQVTRFELAELSSKYKIPIYLIKNQRESNPRDSIQNEKDMMKIKNDLADFLLSEGDYSKRIRIFQAQSRFKVVDRTKMSPTTAPLKSPTSPHESAAIDATEKGPLLVQKGTGTSYQLVYDMVTGIRYATVENTAIRATREEGMNLDYGLPRIYLVAKDFNSTHRYEFTTTGVKSMDSEEPEIKPEAYEFAFKFTDCCPFVFSNIRAYYGISAGSYLHSLAESNALYELKSPGKSDSFFYFSLDSKYLLKTINDEEFEFFKSVLQKYYQYVINNPDTLLCKFFGLYSVFTANYNKEMHFVVMENTFLPEYTMFERYDLKGSTVGRYATTEEKRSDKAILKDLDIRRSIVVGDSMKKIIMEQLEKDTKLLAEIKVMDYSFLFGVARPIASRNRALSDPSMKDKHKSFFRKDGGLASKDEEEVYFFSIIDIFQEWNTRKKMENTIKSFVYEKTEISAVHPDWYRERFLKFLRAMIE